VRGLGRRAGLFFDEILHSFKLSRQEIILLMFLYRQTWCRPNLYKSHGIGPLNSYAEMAGQLNFGQDELSQSLRSLENYGFIETVRDVHLSVEKWKDHMYKFFIPPFCY